MRIFTALTYYRPHYSGLTVYAERLARSLAAHGHEVAVLTSRFNPSLPPEEVMDGVRIIRPDILLHISKGVIMPAMPLHAWKLARWADVVHLHLPQFDAAPIAVLSRLLGKPVVITYHCDLQLPEGLVHAVANRVSDVMNHISAQAAQLIVTNTRDFAQNSAFLRPYMRKIYPIYPPIELAPASSQDLEAFQAKAKIQPGQRLIGMAARLASEKGVEYLMEALPAVLQAYPQARVLFTGQHENVLGEEQYARKLAPMIEQLNGHWTFLGNQSPAERTAFFRTCEVTVLPSINSTESFGMVQIESMACGTPVVSSDLPGVRQPVLHTGMGLIVPPRDPVSLANAIKEILASPERFRNHPQAVAEEFSSEHIAKQYEQIFDRLVSRAAISDLVKE